MSLRGESNDQREFDSTKQSVEILLDHMRLLRQSLVTPRNDMLRTLKMSHLTPGIHFSCMKMLLFDDSGVLLIGTIIRRREMGRKVR
jgi:hypothetical protein